MRGRDPYLGTLLAAPQWITNDLRKRPRDPAQLALMIDIASGEVEDRRPAPAENGKDPAAVGTGPQGWLEGGKARAAKMSAEQRAEIARNAAKARLGLRTTPAMAAKVTERL